MSISHVATGTRTSGNAGTTTTAVARPGSGNSAGNLTLCGRSIKPSTATAAVESGWTQQANTTGGTGASAVDAGATRIAVDHQTLVGGESGSVTFDQGSTPNSVASCMITYSKTTAGPWAIVSTTGDDATHGTGRSATGSAINIGVGDVIVVYVASDTDATTAYTSPAITATGMTITTNERLAAGGVSQNNDCGIMIYEGVVTAGTRANVAPSISLSGGPSSCGPVAFIRLREPEPGTVTVTNLTSGIGTSDPQVTASVSPTGGSRLLMTVVVSHASLPPPDDTATVTGLSGTWNKLATLDYGNRRRGWVFECSDWSGTGTLSIDGPATVQEVGWVLDQVVGSTGLGSIISTNSGGGTPTSVTATLSAAPVAGADVTWSAAVLESDLNMAPESDWTALGATTGGSLGVRRIETAWSLYADTSATWTWDGSAQFNEVFIGILTASTSTDHTDDFTDPVGLLDSISVEQTTERSITDPLGLLDGVAATSTLTQGDPFGLLDAITVVQEAANSLTEPIGLLDSISVVQTIERGATDPIGLLDDATVVKVMELTLGDPLGLVDAATADVATGLTEDDLLGLVDSLVVVVQISVTITDALGLLDAIEDADVTERSFLELEGLLDSLETVAASSRGPPDEALGITDQAVAAFIATRTVGPFLLDENGDAVLDSNGDPVVTDDNDPLGLLDSVTADLSLVTAASVTDGLGLLDSTAVVVQLEVSITDTLGLLDAVVDADVIERSFLELEGLLDSATTVLDAIRSTDEALGITDEAIPALDHVRLVGPFLLDENGDAVLDSNGDPVVTDDNDPIGVLDSVTADLTSGDAFVTDGLGLLDSTAVLSQTYRSADEVLGLLDTASSAVGVQAAHLDLLGLTDAVLIAIDVQVTITDELDLLDTQVVAAGSAAAVTDNLGLLDDAQAARDLVVTITDGVGALDAATVAVAAEVLDGLGLTDSLSVVVVAQRQIDDNLELIDAANSGGDGQLAFLEQLGILDQLSQVQAIQRTLDDSLGLSEELLQEVVVSAVAEEDLGLLDSIVVARELPVTLGDLLGLTDAVTYSTEIPVTLLDQLGILDSVASVQTFVLLVTDSLGALDTASGLSELLRSLTDGLGLLDVAAQAGSFERLASDTAGLLDDAAANQGFVTAVTDLLGGIDEVLRLAGYAPAINDLLGLLDDQATAAEFSRLIEDLEGLTDAMGLSRVLELLDVIGITDEVTGGTFVGNIIGIAITVHLQERRLRAGIQERLIRSNPEDRPVIAESDDGLQVKET